MSLISFESAGKNGHQPVRIEARAPCVLRSVSKHFDLGKEQASPALVVGCAPLHLIWEVGSFPRKSQQKARSPSLCAGLHDLSTRKDS